MVFNSSYTFPSFLGDYLGHMSLIFAMSLFIMKSVNYFGKKSAQGGKCIMAVSTEFLGSQYKTPLKTFFYWV